MESQTTQQSLDSSELELSELTQSSGGLQSVLSEISQVSSSLLSCQACCQQENSSRLAEAVSQLQFLTKVICHDGQHDMYRCVSEDNILEIEMEGQEVCAGSERQQEEEDEDRLLELQLVELTSKLDRMETEMCLVSEESKNLQQALEIKDSVIVDQVAVLLQHFAQTAFLHFLYTITLSQYHDHNISLLVHHQTLVIFYFSISVVAPAALRAVPAGLDSGALGPSDQLSEGGQEWPLQGKAGL